MRVRLGMKSDHKIDDVKVTLEWNYRIEQKFRSGYQDYWNPIGNTHYWIFDQFPFAHLAVVTLPCQQRRAFLSLALF